MPSKLNELLAELRSVLGGRLLDAILPPIIFLLINAVMGLNTAILGSLGLALLFTVIRLWKKQPLRFALAGTVSVLLAIGLVWLLGRAEGYFLPGVISTGITAFLCLISLLAKRPLTAWSSFLARRWPLGWYWHPQVRPAYSETTLLWTIFFGLKLIWQGTLFQSGQANTLAWVQTITGWPALIALLIVTYLYGIWRLRKLNGPSVDEFIANAPQPWVGQQRGF
ncbi:MAG: hypothetical protein Kow002_18020 [Anaerolineales bacterium]